MSAEDRVVHAALAFCRADEAGSLAQAEEAREVLQTAAKALVAQDAKRENPRWQTTTTTLGLGGGRAP